MPLSDTTARAAKPGPKPRKLADGGGLYLLVNPNGSKLWRLKYRVAGRERLLAIGAYPEISLKDARARRDEARRLLAAGTDPSAAKQQTIRETAGADTFGAVAEEWFAHARTAWTPGHAVTVRSRLDRDVLPWLGREKITRIEAPLVLATLRRVEARGAIETAHRIKTIVHQVFAHAVATGQAIRNPAADLPSSALKPVTPKPMAAVIQPAEVGGLLRAIDGYRGTHVVRCAFRLAPLVFVRPGELRAAEWNEIDLDAGQWVIPAARMKLPKAAKADPSRSHIVPLSAQALAVLREIEPLTGAGRYVFPSACSTSRPMSEAAITGALRRMGFDGDTMTWHGFRAMASTLLNELGFPPDAIEAQLAHVQASKVRAAYNRAAHLPERRRMMQAWADYLDGLRAGDGKVTTIGRARA